MLSLKSGDRRALVGRQLWPRIIGLTITGEAFDAVVLCSLAFYAPWNIDLFLGVLVANSFIKVVGEVLQRHELHAVFAEDLSWSWSDAYYSITSGISISGFGDGCAEDAEKYSTVKFVSLHPPSEIFR